MKKRYIGIVCMILGIGIILIPFVKEHFEDHRQREILKLWQREMDCVGSGEETNGTETALKQEMDVESGLEGEEVVGVLRIPSIELEQPILKGATERNLNLSVATVEPTGPPGADGNFAIAGHNSRTYGRHFNRMEELEEGDELFVDTGTENYTYKVTDIYVVEAEDMWVLGDTIDAAEITLITCHYPKEGEVQRLIVKGILKKE